MQKIIFTGPESSGKTTLSKWYATHIGGTYVPEFARLYLEALNRTYTEEDLRLIAKGQLELMESAVQADKQVVCDTGMLVIKIWAALKFDIQIDQVDSSLVQDFDSLYILCKPDIPWEPDPLREDEHNRDWLFDYYEDFLQRLNLKYVLLEGSLEHRKKVLSELKLPE